MGLDMYLQTTKYVSGYDHQDLATKTQFALIAEMTGLSKLVCKEAPGITVTVTCAYWRKANAIHGWFVNKVQKGVDECLAHYVSREQLTELRDTCQDLLDKKKLSTNSKDPSLLALCMEKLPPTEGFFFGTTEINKWFWSDVQSTVEQLTYCLKFEGVEFEYRSSW